MSHVSIGDLEYISSKHKDRRRNQADAMKRAAAIDADLSPPYELAAKDLYGSDTAKHFASLHGRFVHDAHPTLLEEINDAQQDSSGVTVYHSEGSYNLSAEIKVLLLHLPLLCTSYQAFNEYANGKYRSLSHHPYPENGRSSNENARLD